MSSKFISDITHENWSQYQKTVWLETGIHMAYVETGNLKGKPLIFIHGFTDSGHCWLSCFKYFKEDYHIFAIDTRGCGASDKPDQYAYPIFQMASDVVSFIETQNLGQVYLVGHSMGSMIAYTAGFMIPDKIAGIALISTGARMHETPELVAQMKKENTAMGQRELTIEEMHPGHREYPDQENMKYYIQNLKNLKSGYFFAAWTGMSLSDHRNFLQFIKAPVLIIWGKNDELFTWDYQEEICQLLPDAEFLVYDNTHEIPCEDPKKMSQDIFEFFQKINLEIEEKT